MPTNVPNVLVDSGATGSATWNVSTYVTGATGSSVNPIYTISPSYYTTSSNAIWTGNVPMNSDITIQYKNETIEVGKTLKTLMDRLCVIEPNFKLMEKYPALKEAYDNYKMMEALLANEGENENE